MDEARFTAWCLVVAGISGYFFARKEKGRERLRVAEALGEVVKAETRWWMRSEDGDPVSIRFLTDTGLSTFTINTGKRFQIGDRVPVIYEPGHADNAGLRNHRRLGPPWIWILIGILGIAILISTPHA